MNIIDVTKYDFSSFEGRAKFIAENESSIYTGENEDGEPVMIVLEQGEGMTIKTRHAEKPRWWECVEVDKDGFQTCTAYEPVEE